MVSMGSRLLLYQKYDSGADDVTAKLPLRCANKFDDVADDENRLCVMLMLSQNVSHH